MPFSKFLYKSAQGFSSECEAVVVRYVSRSAFLK